MDSNINLYDLILENGNVLTMDAQNRTAEAIAIHQGRIAFVGSTKEINELALSGLNRVDLQGATVLPGFIDAHTHLDLVSIMTSNLVVDCRIPPLRTIAEILEKIREKAHQLPKGKLIIGQSRWVQPFPTQDQLDKVTPHHPVILRNTMHFYLLNSVALKKFLITGDKPTAQELFQIDPGSIIYRDPKTDEPTGQVFDAWNYMFPGSHTPFSYGETKEALKDGINRFVKLGITTVTEFFDFPESSRIYKELHREKELNIRLHLVPCVHGLHKTIDLDSVLNLGLSTGFGDDWIKFGGVKIFVDRGSDTSLASIQLKEMVTRSHLAGIRVFMHANTRKAQDAALEAIESAVGCVGDEVLKQDLTHLSLASSCSQSLRHNLRHRIEHMGNRLVDREYFERVKKTGSIALPTGYFINIGRYFPDGLKVFLYRTMLDHGLCVPGNSDSGGAEPESSNPLYGIWCLVERKTRDGNVLFPEEKISVMEALQVYTKHSAFACLEEDTKGSIERGKFADLVVLEKNPLKIPSDELRNIEVAMTIVGGKIVYRKSSLSLKLSEGSCI